MKATRVTLFILALMLGLGMRAALPEDLDIIPKEAITPPKYVSFLEASRAQLAEEQAALKSREKELKEEIKKAVDKKQRKELITDLRKVQSFLRERQEPGYLSIPELKPRAAKGDIGRFSAVRVEQVISSGEALCRGSFQTGRYVIFLLRGVSTAELKDGESLETLLVLEQTGTFSYRAVAGNRRTVAVYELFDLNQIRPYLPKSKNKS